jgi:hypothetical protein
MSLHFLNQHHKSCLAHSIRHIDDLLGEVEQILGQHSSPFAKYVADSTPLQRKVVHDYIARGRQVLTRIMQEREIPFPTPHCGALWAAQTALLFANVSVDELTPARLRGYGELSEEAAAMLETIRTELRAVIERLGRIPDAKPDWRPAGTANEPRSRRAGDHAAARIGARNHQAWAG